MSRAPFARRLSLLATLGGVTAAGCGLGDVFSSPGPANVVIRYCGDTTLQNGVVVPTRVTVTANGTAVSNPRLRFGVSDTAIVTLIAAGESIVGRKSGGRATVTIQFQSSIFTDTLPTLTAQLHVIGGPSGTPGCP